VINRAWLLLLTRLEPNAYMAERARQKARHQEDSNFHG
jgi:hypothetical protein